MNPQSQKLQLEKMMTIFGTGFRFSVKRIWAIFFKYEYVLLFHGNIEEYKRANFWAKKEIPKS
jgi:hypothetical protein